MILKMQEPVFYGLFMVISGGQCGADQGGLEAAQQMGVATGGLAPKGWQTCRGAQPQLARFNLVEDTEPGYEHRTKVNVEKSDGTVVVASNPNSPGSLRTIKHAMKLDKPCLLLRIDENTQDYDGFGEKLAEWIEENNVNRLNVAGNRDHFGSLLHHHVTYRIVTAALMNLQRKGHLVLEAL